MIRSDTRGLIFTADARFSVNAPAEGKPAVLSGYALVWNQLSSDRGGYKVRLRPGSAKFNALTHALYNHDFSDPLGDTESQSLRILPADAFGQKVEIDLPDTQRGRDVLTLARDKRMKGMSFHIDQSTPPAVVKTTEAGETVIELISFSVDEVSVTANPAFTDARFDLKTVAPLSFSARTTQALRLERMKFDGLIVND